MTMPDNTTPVEVAPVALPAQKPWYTSKTIIASIVGFLATAFGLVGYNLAAETQVDIVEVISQVVALITFAVAAWGRWTANSVLK